MKRLISIMLIICFMITLTTGVFASEKNIVDERVKDFKDRIAEIG